MSIILSVFLYLLIWWIMLFTTLPFGIEKNEEEDKGFDAGAPKIHNIKKKMIINSFVALVVLGIIEALVATGVIDWHAMFKDAWQ